jgi:hypothetical protein
MMYSRTTITITKIPITPASPPITPLSMVTSDVS